MLRTQTGRCSRARAFAIADFSRARRDAPVIDYGACSYAKHIKLLYSG